MAYVLARQDTRRKLSEPKTNTPHNALFCGVFRVNLLTSEVWYVFFKLLFFY